MSAVRPLARNCNRAPWQIEPGVERPPSPPPSWPCPTLIGEPGRGYPRLVAEPQKIQCPLLCLNDPSDDGELRRQAAAAVEAAPNPASRHQVFTPDDGTVLYRQLDNFSLKHRVIFDWLDDMLGER